MERGATVEVYAYLLLMLRPCPGLATLKVSQEGVETPLKQAEKTVSEWDPERGHRTQDTLAAERDLPLSP